MMLLTAPLVSSIDATINVKSEPYHNIVLRVYNPQSGSSVTSMTQEADEKGITQFTLGLSLSTINVELIEVHPLTNEKRNAVFEGVPVTSLIELEFEPLESPVEESPAEIPQETEEVPAEEPEVNVTVEEEKELEVQTQEIPVENSAKGLTGFIVQDGKPAEGAYFLGIAALLVIGGLVFMAYRAKQSIIAAQNNTDDFGKELKDAEKKLKEAQREIEDIKSRRNPEMKKAEEEFLKAKANYEKMTGKKVAINDQKDVKNHLNSGLSGS